ncbi:MAG: hypothetical protein EZS28_045891, partial [Streblomastix strix]
MDEINGEQYYGELKKKKKSLIEKVPRHFKLEQKKGRTQISEEVKIIQGQSLIYIFNSIVPLILTTTPTISEQDNQKKKKNRKPQFGNQSDTLIDLMKKVVRVVGFSKVVIEPFKRAFPREVAEFVIQLVQDTWKILEKKKIEIEKLEEKQKRLKESNIDDKTDFDMELIQTGSDIEKEEIIGKYINDYASADYENLAGKITGIILQLELPKLIQIVQSYQLLNKQISDAVIFLIFSLEEEEYIKDYWNVDLNRSNQNIQITLQFDNQVHNLEQKQIITLLDWQKKLQKEKLMNVRFLERYGKAMKFLPKEMRQALFDERIEMNRNKNGILNIN